jgi:hypothetical protein
MATACGDDFHLITPETLLDYISPGRINDRHGKLQPAIRTCCIRAALLAEYGGWWWDADTIALRSPQELTQKHDSAAGIYLTWDEEPQRVLNGYIYLTRDAAAEWLGRINWTLTNDFDNIRWCSMGEGILTPLLLDNPEAVHVPRRLFLPIDVDSSVETFFNEGNPQTYMCPDTVSFGLNHSYFMYHHRDLMTPPWDGSLLIHRLLRAAEAAA